MFYKQMSNDFRKLETIVTLMVILTLEA